MKKFNSFVNEFYIERDFNPDDPYGEDEDMDTDGFEEIEKDEIKPYYSTVATVYDIHVKFRGYDICFKLTFDDENMAYLDILEWDNVPHDIMVLLDENHDIVKEVLINYVR